MAVQRSGLEWKENHGRRRFIRANSKTGFSILALAHWQRTYLEGGWMDDQVTKQQDEAMHYQLFNSSLFFVFCFLLEIGTHWHSSARLKTI